VRLIAEQILYKQGEHQQGCCTAVLRQHPVIRFAECRAPPAATSDLARS
jgi:hypothetical protein